MLLRQSRCCTEEDGVHHTMPVQDIAGVPGGLIPYIVRQGIKIPIVK
jgi:hypothetical protein